MVKQHLKRIAVPKTWTLSKKAEKFVARPNPGAHSMSTSIPLIIILRDLLGYTKTKRETVKVLLEKNVLVNQKRVKDSKFPVGIMDTLSFTEIDEHYRIMINKKGNLCLNKTTKERTMIRPVKIAGKSTLKKGLIQLNFTDGTNMIIKKDDYKVGDTLIIEFPGKIKEHYSIAQGSYVYFTKGKQVGNSGVIENVSQEKIIFKQKDGSSQETSRKYAFVVGKEKSLIVLPE